MTPASGVPAIRTIAQGVLLAVGYWLLADLGLRWALTGSAVSAVYPAAGLAVAGLILGGVRLWPAIVAGRLLAFWLDGRPDPIGVQLAVSFGTAASAAAAAYGLRRFFAFDPSLRRLRDVLWLAGWGALLTPIIGATVGTLAIAIETGTLSERYWVGWFNWWVGNVTGVLVVTPLILAWSRNSLEGLGRKWWTHLVLSAMVAAACSWVIFGPLQTFLLRTVLLFPVLAWAALACGVRGAAVAVVPAAALAVWGTTMGYGPLAEVAEQRGMGDLAMLLPQQFVAVASLTALVLAAVAEELRGRDALRRAEQEAARVSQDFQVVTDAVPALISQVDAAGRYVFCNRAYEEWFGVSRDEIIGRPVREVIGESAFERVRGHVEAALSGARVQYEAEMPYRSAGPRYVRIDCVPNFRPDGAVAGYFALVTDLTARRRAEEAARASEERFRTLANRAPVLVWIAGVDKLCTWFNRPWLEFTGRTMEEELGDGWTQGVHPEDFDRCLATYSDAFDRRAPFEMDYRLRRADGAWRWLLDHGQPLHGPGGVFEGYIGSCIDITERKRAEARDAFLVSLDDAVRPLIDPSEITLTAATLLGRHLDVDRCAYADIEADQDTMNVTGNYLRSHEVKNITGRLRFTDFGQEALASMRAGRPFVVHDVDLHTPPIENPDAYRAAEIGAAICVPLQKDTRFVAAMAVHTLEPRAWREDEIDLVRLVAARCWESIERARVERELRTGEERLRLALVGGGLGDWAWDARTDVVSLGPRAAQIFGLTTGQEITWASLRDMIHPEDADSARDAFLAALESRGEYEIEYRFRRPHGGGEIWVAARGRGIYTGKEPMGMIGVVQDVTERRAAQEERERLLEAERAARSEAERAARLKDEFLATVSHELRTPLNAIVGWSQLMRSGKLHDSDTQLQAAETIHRNAKAQAQIIDDLLEMSRIESGKVRLDVRRLDLSGVIASAADAVRLAAEAKGIRLEADSRPSAAFMINGDPARLQQVVWNLLSNAVKFTPEGGTVRVTLTANGPHAELRVADSGMGIDPDFLPHVFERFRQADGGASRRFGGLGLGLAIVKQLVEMHGGEVHAESDGRGRGATFVVRLPTAADVERYTLEHPTPQPEDHPRDEDRPDLSAIRVVLIDDDEDGRSFAARVLEASGAEVVSVNGAELGLREVERFRPHVILSDIGMPGLDGYEFVRQLRTLPADRGGRTPAAALTAFARADDRRRALLAGFQEHIAKPVDAADLVALVATLASQRVAELPVPE